MPGECHVYINLLGNAKKYRVSNPPLVVDYFSGFLVNSHPPPRKRRRLKELQLDLIVNIFTVFLS